jgi:hypothetical protein
MRMSYALASWNRTPPGAAAAGGVGDAGNRGSPPSSNRLAGGVLSVLRVAIDGRG